ncbi:MAG TPA: hypothetical protein ENJ64_06855 [Thiotrichales bacterium]|nr:hypothetical protein [Thiotrichales bacterium]
MNKSADTHPDKSIVAAEGGTVKNDSAAPTTGHAAAQQQKNKNRSITFRSLAQLNELIEAGVPALALSLLEEEQRRRPAFTADWYAFEYKRIVIYSAMSDWDMLEKRVNWLLETAIPEKQITQKIRLWFETQQVIARLQSGQPQKALRQLQFLIWNNDVSKIDHSLPPIWRRLVIRAYVALKLDEDAQKALVKYNQDFQAARADVDWRLLQARVLLRTGRPRQAEEILAAMETDKMSDGARALRLLAQLQSTQQQSQSARGKLKHAQAQQRIKVIAGQMRKKLDGQVLSPSVRWAYSYVAYRAAVLLQDSEAQMLNLESMLSLALKYPVLGEDYTVGADDLWALYKREGIRIANEHNLLVGDDPAWLALIKKLAGKTGAAKRQALYLSVTLGLTSRNQSIRQQAHQTVVETLESQRNGLALVNRLYLHSNTIHDFSVMPPAVRYRLVDYALGEGDIAEAAQLMKSLPEPPQGDDAFDWRMRKARVLVLEGEYEESARLLTKTISALTALEDKALDRYIQVVFDFQTVNQHRQALALFDLIRPAWLNDKLKREIYFWKAESFFALKNFDRAALYYLKSATALKNEENDLWAQSARYKAAGALAKAGIYDDAEKVYKDLLQVTVSESRKALIKQNLQHIRLLKRAQRNPVAQQTPSD